MQFLLYVRTYMYIRAYVSLNITTGLLFAIMIRSHDTTSHLVIETLGSERLSLSFFQRNLHKI